MTALATKYPRLHRALHWFLVFTSALLLAKDDIVRAAGETPDPSLTLKLVGWLLALAAFSNALGKRVEAIDAALPEPAAPAVPASEAVTKDETPVVPPPLPKPKRGKKT